MTNDLDIEWSAQGECAIHAGSEEWGRGAISALAWRYAGETVWRWNRDAKTPVIDAGGNHLTASVRLGPTVARIDAMRRDDSAWELFGDLKNEADRPIELARFHFLHGVLTRDASLLALTENTSYSHGESLPPHRDNLEEGWAHLNTTWPRLNDPIHIEPDWGVATDVGILIVDRRHPGLVVGFTGPGAAFGEIGLHMTGAPEFYIGVRLDNVLVQPGESRVLERVLLCYGDWQLGMRRWAEACARELDARVVRPPLVGWCSWYQHYTGVRPEHVRHAAQEFAEWPIPPGGRLIQIDDGFQIMPGDWRPNERFVGSWAELPREIAATGSIPGLWLAPTTVFHRHPILREHPDWLQRLSNGEPAVSFSNWGWCDKSDFHWGDRSSPTYYLDPDHPGARAFMADIVSDAVRAGWRHLKLDFTYALSTARQAVNRSRTAMQSLRELYRLFREAAGPDTIICACIGEMGRYALGYADTARIGGDIGGDWSTLGNNLKEFIPRLCVNGVWWNGDPDVFYMRAEHSTLTLEESWVLTGTVGLIGGVFLTSDFASQWSNEAAGRVRHFWNEAGPTVPSSQRVVSDSEGRVIALRVTSGDRHRIGVYNWTDEARTVRVPLVDVGLNDTMQIVRLIPTGAVSPCCLINNELICEAMPARSLRIIEGLPG